MRIWGRLIDDGKIIESKETTIANYDYHNFTEYVREIAYLLDIPTPMILDKHIVDFAVYKTTKFTQDDFVEKINFEKLILELIE